MEIMHKGMWTGRRVLYLSVDAIRANPDQPRKYFEPEALRELAESIGRYGILQPLTVRRGEDGYELIAGERRLRAAKLAGLREVPCLAVRSDEEESALLSLIENLQRQDLHYMEEAAAIDGCSRFMTLIRVIIPMTLPGIGTAFALSFFSGWGQYLYPLVLTRDAAKTPVTVGIARLIDNQTPWEMVMTGTLISIVPAVIIYLLVQKSLIKGMSSGAVK